MKIAILSDIHAGLGANDSDLRDLQKTAVKRSADYLQHQDIDTLILNGDTTDHLANVLAADTSADIAQNVLAPLTALINERKGRMKTILLAGNTDWPVADLDIGKQQIFFDYTGFPKEQVVIPEGGLLHVAEADDVSLVLTHGHAFKPAQWGHVGPMTKQDYRTLWETLKTPHQTFLDAISATSGSHRSDYLKAVVIGSVVKFMPRSRREQAVGILGSKFTTGYEQQYAHALAVLTQQTRKKALGVMGHTHIAGIRGYEGMTILNTGTTGAKPNPLQRLNDPRAHMAEIDTAKGTYGLLQTFNAAQPSAKPDHIARGNFSDL